MKLSTIIFILGATCLSFDNLLAQSPQKEIHEREQLWVGYFNQTRLTKRVGLWMDVHYRQTDNFIGRPFQFLIRPAINFFIKENVRLQTGYTYINHFPPQGLTISRPEHRGWQQIWWNQKYVGLTTLQWLRIEERFNKKIANNILQPETYFSVRFRYNYSFFIPLKGKEMKPRIPFLALINEVFINLGNHIVYNTFDQNRLFIGLGYPISSHLNAQIGYMNIYQQEASGNNYFSTHAIRFFVFHNLDLREKE